MVLQRQSCFVNQAERPDQVSFAPRMFSAKTRQSVKLFQGPSPVPMRENLLWRCALQQAAVELAIVLAMSFSGLAQKLMLLEQVLFAALRPQIIVNGKLGSKFVSCTL